MAARTSTSPRSVAEEARTDTAVHPAQQPAAARKPTARRRPPIAPVLVLVLIGLLVAGVAYGAYVFLPTATVTLRPAAVAVRAPQFAVTADPNVAVVDATAGVIPAQIVSVPVHVAGTFNATGVDVHDTKATGSVRFSSRNSLSDVTIPAGTVVSTSDGVDFVTVDDVVVPQGDFDHGVPGRADADIRAAKTGPSGNVAADAITRVPPNLDAQGISVTNPDATSGGKHVEDLQITQEDYDAAVAVLSSELPAALQLAIANPQAVPRGLVAFPETAQLSAGQPDQDAGTLVDELAPTFDLALDATADVTAVNESQIEQVAAARVRAAHASGQNLVSDAVEVAHDAGTVIGGTVVYSVTASGRGYTDPDPQTVVAALRGKSLADARSALAPFGVADIAIWPEFVDHLPDQAARISVQVVAPSAAPATLAPSASRAPSAPSRPATPSASSSPSAP
jgi:hypothetical protein